MELVCLLSGFSVESCCCRGDGLVDVLVEYDFALSDFSSLTFCNQ